MQVTSQSDPLQRVASALKSAAQATGAGFDYLLRTAKRESGFDSDAKAPSSSAKGLFQFIDQTWLQVMKEDGPKLGLATEAANITKSASGRYTVADPQRKAELLSLRDDPQTAALLAGAFTQRNAGTLESALGRSATDGELYAAHFLGARGAVDLVTLASSKPNASAAEAFPAQASANRAIFFDKGRARSLAEVYVKVTASPDAPTAVAAPATATPATAPGASTNAALAIRETADDASYGPFNGGAENDHQAFHSLFKTGRRSPVSAYVSQTWSSFGEAGLASDVSTVRRTAAAAPVAAGARIDTAFALTTGRTAAAAPATVAEATTDTDAAAAVKRAAHAPLDRTSFLGARLAPPSVTPASYEVARR